MKLSFLHEGKPTVYPPASSKNVKNRKKQAYDTIGNAKNGDWTNKSSVYADTTAVNKPDEKLLANFRGKGLA